MKRIENGAALVEFALVLPLLLLLSFLTTEFGRALYQYDILTKAVRDGARYLSTQIPADPTAIARARNLVVYGNLTGSPDTPLALGLAPAQVPDPTWQTTGTAPAINTVTVRISGYRFQPLFASAFGFEFAPGGFITFPDITATMRSFL
jgi:hypothetical protein